MSAYRRLLAPTGEEEPSEILNDIDEARAELRARPDLSLDRALCYELSLRELEQQLHLKFTPPLMRTSYGLV